MSKRTAIFFSLLSLVLSLNSCINKSNLKKEEKTASNEEFEKVEIEYAKGFRVDYFEGGKYIEVLHPKNGEVLDKFLLLAKENAEIPTKYKLIQKFKLPLQNIVSQSTTHVSYLAELDQLNSLKAVMFASYLKNPEARKLYLDQSIQDLSNANGLNKELLVDLDPEVIFMYPFDEMAVETIKEYVSPILTTEYLEESPLAKAEWIKFFALFYNAEEIANTQFNNVVEEYRSQTTDKQTGTCFMNLPYQNDWNCPPGNSYSAQLIKDAGLNYIYRNEIQEINLKKTDEEIIDQCMDLDYWIIFASRPAEFSMQGLLNEKEFYKEFKSVKNDNVIICNTLISDYFGDALIEPQVLLQNLNSVLTGERDSTKYFYRLK